VVRFPAKPDTKDTPQFGLIGEEVAKLNQFWCYPIRQIVHGALRLCKRDVAHEFLKEHRKGEDLKKDFQVTVAQQQREITAIAATVKSVPS
jgi:hypothetical protein